jgi:cytochrome c-type biogenesis protein CcmH
LLFWAVAGVLAAVAAGLILMRAAGAARQAAVADPAPVLYRRQLSEIDDLAERGLLGEPERKAAHAEAARRLLAAADAPVQPWNAGPGARRVALAAAAAAPVLALALYLQLGAPGMADQPYAKRLDAWKHSDLATLSAPEMAAVLRDAVARRAPDAEGYRLLGLTEMQSDDPLAAVRALRRAADLAPQRPDVWAMLGEAEMYAAGGKASVAAQDAFRRVLELKPGDPAARFVLAEGKVEAGRSQEAQADLKALLADLPANDARRKAVEAEIGKLENRPTLGADPQQLAMIRGMVAGLDAKLKANPDDPGGWVRLVRAYAVLGDTAARDAAYATARARYARAPDILEQLDAAARAEPMR